MEGNNCTKLDMEGAIVAIKELKKAVDEYDAALNFGQGPCDEELTNQSGVGVNLSLCMLLCSLAAYVAVACVAVSNVAVHAVAVGWRAVRVQLEVESGVGVNTNEQVHVSMNKSR